MTQKNWDKYEVALLIEAYQDIKQGRVDKNSALVALSQNLRKMAQNDGLEIDDTFRNLNGMQWQLGFIERAFIGEDYESRTPPRIFVEMVALYNQNQQEYLTVLAEAHRKIIGTTEVSDEEQKELFAMWLAHNTNLSSASVIANIAYVSAYANKHGSKKDFWSYRNYKEFNVARVKISGSKLFKLMHGKEHRQFERAGKLYSDFLKEQYKEIKPVARQTTTQCREEEHKEQIITETPTVTPAQKTALSEDVVSSDKVVVSDSNELILDLNSIPDLSFTKPIDAMFKGVQLEALNWKTVYVSVLHLLYRVYSGRLNNYIGKSLCGGTRVDLSFKSTELKSPKMISSDYTVYAESNLSANDIAKRLVAVFRICGVSLEQLIIKYKKSESIQRTEEDDISDIDSVAQGSVVSNGTEILDEYTKWLVQERGMSESTGRGYGSNLKNANIRAQEMGLLDVSLFDIADEDLQETVSKILSDSRFSKYNVEQHNRFSAALNAYLIFKLGESASIARRRRIIVRQNDESDSEESSSKIFINSAEAKTIDEYVQWLVQVRGMSESTSRGYGSNLKMANIRAQEYGVLDGSLFDIADEDLQEAVSGILSDSEFSKYNSEQHNRFSAALQAYLLFKIGEKATGVRTRKPRSLKETVTCPDDLKALLLKKFPYGIRVDSSIDMTKLKNFAEMFEVALPESEEQLKAQIAVAGIAYDGKTYFISDEVLDGIKEKISNIFAEGYSVIYYEELFGKNFEWFDEHHISSWELVREILDKKSDDIYVSKNFLRQSAERINEADAVEQEIERVWGDNVVHTYDEMYECLPYIPDEKIKFYLSYCKKFVWSTHETFAWIDKVVITEEEKQAIIDYVTNECELVGHASIANAPLGNIEEENYQISITAIYDAIYNLILIDKFAINGKILTKINSEIDALTLAKAYCEGKDICSFAELNDYVTSINGTANRQITFRAAYDQMVRVEENKFVTDKSVNFDVDAIDELLEEIISGDFASIKSVATFIMFPNCGFTWTHYLVESFCYRFSRKFRLDVINFNDKNAGIIVKKEVKLSFEEMLAVVAANSNLDLNAELIGQYLYDNGYVARRKMPLIDTAVEKAKRIREGR